MLESIPAKDTSSLDWRITFHTLSTFPSLVTIKTVVDGGAGLACAFLDEVGVFAGRAALSSAGDAVFDCVAREAYLLLYEKVVLTLGATLVVRALKAVLN